MDGLAEAGAQETATPELLRGVRELEEAGGHFVLLRESGLPLWRGWPDRRPALDVLRDHSAPLGIIPSSLRKLVADQDAGDAARLWEACGVPVLTLPTPRGCHGWYDEIGRRFNRVPFDLGFASGDLIQGPRAYVRLYEDGAEKLAGAVLSGRAAPIQEELFDLSEVTEAEVVPEAWAPRPRRSPVLEEVRPGGRNDSLFDAVRFWAYAQDMGRDLGGWKRRCRVRALEENERFPFPLPEREVCRTVALSVATWTWSRPERTRFSPYDHGSEAQRRRAVKRHHGNAREWTLRHLRERDEYIRLQVRGIRRKGASRAERKAVVEALAERFGLSASQVRRIAQ